MSSQLVMNNYNEKTKNTCTWVSITLVLTIAYFTIPYKTNAFFRFFLKLALLGILGATIYYQFQSLHELLNINELFTNEQNTQIRNQYLIGALFSVILASFFLFITKELFF